MQSLSLKHSCKKAWSFANHAVVNKSITELLRIANGTVCQSSLLSQLSFILMVLLSVLYTAKHSKTLLLSLHFNQLIPLPPLPPMERSWTWQPELASACTSSPSRVTKSTFRVPCRGLYQRNLQLNHLYLVLFCSRESFPTFPRMQM